ncbi:MAG: hypothetical protein KDK70_36840, partial [Myxococcales bacterium]|nr:hypothetical protein [Myxococcales bacterium]
MTSERADETGLPGWCQTFVGLLCLAGAFAYGSHLDHAGVLLLPVGLLVVSAGLVRRRALSSQLLVRAVLWCNLLLGFLMSLDGGAQERPVGCAVALITGTALLVLRRRGLGHPSASFSPAA